MHQVWIVIGILIIILAAMISYQQSESAMNETETPPCDWCGKWKPGMRPRCPREEVMQQRYIRHMKNSGVVPREALKETSERWRTRSNISIYDPGTTYQYAYDGQIYDYSDHMSPMLRYPKKSLAYRGDFNNGIASVNSRDIHVPKSREYNPPWEKVDVVSTTDSSDDTIMNLYRRPISEGMDVWQYKVEDKHGFELLLPNREYIEDGDVIETIGGKESKGSWKATIDSQNKWVYF